MWPWKLRETELTTKINEANALTPVALSVDGSDILTTVLWTTPTALNDFEQAILDADAVLNKVGVTQAEVDQAVLKLANAVTAYKSAQNPGTKVDNGDPVDLEALLTSIDAAKAVTPVSVSADGSDILTTVLWTTPTALNDFKKAITDAIAVLNNEGLTQAVVNQAVVNLDNAITAYTDAQTSGTDFITYTVGEGASIELLHLHSLKLLRKLQHKKSWK